MDTKSWSNVKDLGYGILLYEDVLPQNLQIINRIEKSLDGSNINYKWNPAFVGYQQRMPEYRDCVDFKYKKIDIESDKSETANDLKQLWQDVYDRQNPAVQHYCKIYNINNLRYWEAFNFIKYEPGHHFQEHHDHGYSYNCTVSLVAYLNDDYEGGELYFRLQNLTIKPKAGDLYVFPSNYMYPHQAKEVKSGTKYCIVTMLDYSDKYHSSKFYQETGS